MTEVIITWLCRRGLGRYHVLKKGARKILDTLIRVLFPSRPPARHSRANISVTLLIMDSMMHMRQESWQTHIGIMKRIKEMLTLKPDIMAR